MFTFDYDNFKESLKNSEINYQEQLMDDIEKVKAFVEKGLTLFLESSSNSASMCHPGVDI